MAVALAASLLAAVAAGWWWIERPVDEPLIVAMVELARGPAVLSGTGVDDRAVLVGEALPSGTILSSTDGPVALRVGGNRSVRLAARSRLRLEEPGRLELLAGKVYVDSDPGMPADVDLAVATPAGIVEELGTQYQVRLDETGAVWLGVREGSVVLTDGGRYELASGHTLSIQPDGTVERGTVSASGPDWDWVLAVAQAPEIEGRTLAEFLVWVERESGRDVRFEDASLEAAAETIRLHGSIDGLTPNEALEVILAGSGLAAVEREGVIAVRRSDL